METRFGPPAKEPMKALCSQQMTRVLARLPVYQRATSHCLLTVSGPDAAPLLVFREAGITSHLRKPARALTTFKGFKARA